MAGKATAVDPGSHTVKVLSLKDGKHGLEVSAFAAVPAQQGAEGLVATGIPLAGTVAGVAGRDMTLRYTQVPPAPDWQLRNLMELEISDLSSQSGDELSADYNLLPISDEESGMDTVLMSLASCTQIGADVPAGASDFADAQEMTPLPVRIQE